ncbi:MAG: hypothetical protein NVS9B1_25630 [Candidatus Dormibacteraceae bacterium]
MPAWALKLLAVGVTALAAAGSAVYVGGNVKSAAAPLHPRVVAGHGGGLLAALGVQAAAATAAPNDLSGGGQLHLSPSVESMNDQQPLTFTSVS